MKRIDEEQKEEEKEGEEKELEMDELGRAERGQIEGRLPPPEGEAVEEGEETPRLGKGVSQRDMEREEAHAEPEGPVERREEAPEEPHEEPREEAEEEEQPRVSREGDRVRVSILYLCWFSEAYL
jgi:hypothetical protein